MKLILVVCLIVGVMSSVSVFAQDTVKGEIPSSVDKKCNCISDNYMKPTLEKPAEKNEPVRTQVKSAETLTPTK